MSLYVRFISNDYLILEKVSKYILHNDFFSIVFDNGRTSVIKAEKVLYIGFCEDLWYNKEGE